MARQYVKAERTPVFEPPPSLARNAHVAGGLPGFQKVLSVSRLYTKVPEVKVYNESISRPDEFWRAVSKDLHFDHVSDKGLEWNFDVRKGDIFVRFMAGSRSNMAYNCLDRQVARGLGNRVAFHWAGNEPRDERTITYAELLEQVKGFAAVLRDRGVATGDVVAIYMPMCLELCVAMLACARIGALHSVVFAGFSADALAARLIDGGCRILVTADGVFRGNKPIPLKAIADAACELASKAGNPIQTVVVLEHLNTVTTPRGAQRPPVQWKTGRDIRWRQALDGVRGRGLVEKESAVQWFDAEHPLFVLYTSGSTGKPKGIVHSTAGYMTYVYYTAKTVFDIHPERDVFWCTADCGWITGHSYVLYGPLLNGATSVIFEGIPTYPNPDRFWQIVDTYRVTKLYTSPTAVRSLMGADPKWLTTTSRKTLQIIGVAGEPINEPVWLWIKQQVSPNGGRDTAIVDTYWQTETGGHVLSPMPGTTPAKPGSATFALPGHEAVLLDANDNRIEGAGEGRLCLARAWPSCARTVWRDHARFVDTYFRPSPGYYLTGDGARRDADGYLWVTGRTDDLMNVSGHLLSTAEIESAMVSHPKIAEAAVVAAPHDIKGSAPYAFITLVDGVEMTPSLRDELLKIVRAKIGALAIPDVVQPAPGLPKTRSGKVTRRILRKIAEGAEDGFGDVTTLVDESVIDALIKGRRELLLHAEPTVFVQSKL